MVCRRWLLVLSLLLLLARSTVAEADATNSGPAGYSDAIAKAIDEFAAGNYPEAREEFRRAFELFPNARALRGLGMVEFEMRNYGESVRLLDEALASKVRPLDGAMRDETQALLERARRYLGEVHVQVEPSAANVRVDGMRVDLGPDGTLLLEVGEHAVEVQAAGWAPERRKLRVQGGQRNVLRISLSPLPADELAHQRSDRPAYKKWWVWTTVGVIAAAGVVTTVVLLKRDRDADVRPVNGTNTTGVSLQTLAAF